MGEKEQACLEGTTKDVEYAYVTIEYRRLDQIGQRRLLAAGDGRTHYAGRCAGLDETAQATGAPPRCKPFHRNVPKEGRGHLGGHQVARSGEGFANM